MTIQRVIRNRREISGRSRNNTQMDIEMGGRTEDATRDSEWRAGDNTGKKEGEGKKREG